MLDFTNKEYQMTFQGNEAAMDMVMVNHVFHSNDLFCIFAPKQSIESYNPEGFVDYRVCKCYPIPTVDGNSISFVLDFEEYDAELKKLKNKLLEMKVVKAIEETETILENHFYQLVS